MAAVRLLRPSSFVFVIVFLLSSPSILSLSDSEALLKLKKSFNNPKSLDSWGPDSVPCTRESQWVGVVCFNGIITGLRLGNLGLSGTIAVDALLEIPGLRSLSFVNNSFTGPIPEFNRMGALKAIYLTKNQFSGEIPSSYFLKMESLKKLWLAGNRFTGPIPASLAKLPHLMELHLEHNQFSGPIPPIGQTSLMSLDLSNNKLQGEIPESLSKFNASSFASNAGLCGKQLGKDCNQLEETEPSSAPSPTSMVADEDDPKGQEEPNHKVAGAAVTLTVVILMLLVGVIIVLRRRDDEEFDVLGRENLDEQVEVHVSGTNRSRTESSRKMSSTRRGSHSSHTSKGGGMGDLVMVNDEKGHFGLPDLMKAAAEVMGNGGLGSAYKAVMADGVAVVVKRMREMNRLGRDGFDAEIRRLGKLHHRNILNPLAYHYRKEEKLLVYEFIPKGSLLYLLHGDRGPCHAELNWPARLRIIQGIAKGLGYLHAELFSSDIPHGNLKSSNVLLGSNYEPLLADYGFYPLLTTSQAAQAMFAYKSPEALQFRQVSPKSDVYCLGIIILELLTGKFPSQYLSNGKGGTDVVQWVLSAISERREAELFDPEISGSKNSLGEMARLLHIGAACTESSPEQRPEMREAIKRIHEIQAEGHPETRSVPLAPSLRDGYADAPSATYSHASNVREGFGDQLSGQRPESFRDRSGRRNGDSFAFAIS